MKKKFSIFTAFNYLSFSLLSFISLFPIYSIASAAFSTEADIKSNGFAIFPEHFTLEAFQWIFRYPANLISALMGTIVYAVIGSLAAIIVEAMMGYALTRPNFCLKKLSKALLIGAMFVSAGIIPSYILNTQVYHLENTWSIYIFSGLVSPFNVFIYRTFFSQINISLSESAMLDGATSMQILYKIILPLSKPILASQLFLSISGRWKDYTITLYYITDKMKYTLEYYVQVIIKDAQSLVQSIASVGMSTDSVPLETMRFAVCFLVIIPMIIIFPLFQRYFSTGLTVGSVKG